LTKHCPNRMRYPFSGKFLISTISIALVYIVMVVWSMNLRLVASTIFSPYPVIYKFKLLIALLSGMWTTMSSFSLTMLVIVALLTGANLTFIFQKMALWRSLGKLHVVVGGSSLLGLIGAGCASCGLPILSLLGLSGSLIYFLPFGGTELSVISALLLFISFAVLIKSCSQKNVC